MKLAAAGNNSRIGPTAEESETKAVAAATLATQAMRFPFLELLKPSSI